MQQAKRKADLKFTRHLALEYSASSRFKADVLSALP